MGGSRDSATRALWTYRRRIFQRWGVPHTPAWANANANANANNGVPEPLAPPAASSASGLPVVLVVQTKRVVTNLAAFVAAINAEGIADARLIKWEGMSFAEQLKAMRGAATSRRRSWSISLSDGAT